MPSPARSTTKTGSRTCRCCSPPKRKIGERVGPRIALGDQWLGVHESGRGEPVVLVHSGGFSARQWRKLADALSATHHVLAPDLLGYGASSKWPVGTLFHLRQDLAALEALLETFPAPAHWVGHSGRRSPGAQARTLASGARSVPRTFRTGGVRSTRRTVRRRCACVAPARTSALPGRRAGIRRRVARRVRRLVEWSWRLGWSGRRSESVVSCRRMEGLPRSEVDRRRPNHAR